MWGPHPDGVWTAFHCVPLFAAIDSLKPAEIGPTRPPEPGGMPPAAPDPGPTPAPVTNLGGTIGVAPPPPLLNPDDATRVTPPASPPPSPFARRPLPPDARPGAPAPVWVRRDTWIILDLPGPMAVEAAVWLVGAAAYQPVCTFDNWPHAAGVLRAEATLAELLRWATTIAEARPSLDAGSPPLWICDSERLGARSPTPRQFDNRYYLDDSILPGPALLRQAGIRRAVYVTPGDEDVPLADLDGYFKELLAAGVAVLHVSVMSAGREPSPVRLPPLKVSRPKGFRRSAAGGFGQHVPDPSSGGSGG